MAEHADLTGAELHEPGLHAASHATGQPDAISPGSIGAGTGTVTSVAQTVPAEFSVAGSPVTTTGTLAISKATQTANTVWAGPTSGSAAQPAFRATVADDLPASTPDVPWAATADVTVANTTTPTNLLATNTGTKLIPAAFWAVGRSFRLKVWGYYEIDVSAPAATATLTLKFSNDIASFTFQFPADTGTAADYFEIEAIGTCRVTGGSGSIMAQMSGQLHFPGSDTPIHGVPAQPMAATTHNLSTTQTVSLLWAWDVADADNTVTVTNAILELL